MNITKPESSLFAELRRIAAVQKSSAVGPLICAEDVMRLARDWESHREETGGLDATTAFKRHLGYPLAYYSARASAVDALGRDVLGWMSHDLAVWLVHRVPEPRRREAKEVVRFAFAEQCKRRLAVTKAQAIPHILKMLGAKASPKCCETCLRYRAKLVELGVDPDTVG